MVEVTTLVDWRCVLVDYGELSVIEFGVILILGLLADKWASQEDVSVRHVIVQ